MPSSSEELQGAQFACAVLAPWARVIAVTQMGGSHLLQFSGATHISDTIACFAKMPNSYDRSYGAAVLRIPWFPKLSDDWNHTNFTVQTNQSTDSQSPTLKDSDRTGLGKALGIGIVTISSGTAD